MKIRHIILSAALLCASGAAWGQEGVAAGRMIRMSEFTYSDMMSMAQYDYSFSTARSAAMGGAFVSLGADLSSMSLNPAGLGMYRSSEFSFSPSLMFNKTTSGPMAPGASGDDSFTRFALGNIGMALNILNGSRGLVSVTFGFGYNKLADFNYKSHIGLDSVASIAEVFAQQAYGLTTDELNHPFAGDVDLHPAYWSPALGYQTYMINEESPEGSNRYVPFTFGNPNNDLYVNSTGRIGEYDLSLGMNFDNRVYVGFTLGIQDIYNRQELMYDEYFDQGGDTDAGWTGDMPLDFMYGQTMVYRGVGVNLKAGVIVRPIDPLRIGFAIHTPTFASIDSEYFIPYMDSYTQDPDLDPVYTSSISDKWNYNYTTPTRLMLGASYQFGDIGLLSLDWEHAWYNGMRLHSTDDFYMDEGVRNAYKNDIKYSFKGADNLRVGLEIRPLPEFALRAGYAWYGSGVRANDNDRFVTPTENMPYSTVDKPVAIGTSNYSAGIGYRSGSFSLDAAYVFSDVKYSDYALYWYDGPDNAGNSLVTGAGPIESSMKRHLVTLTAGFRF